MQNKTLSPRKRSIKRKLELQDNKCYYCKDDLHYDDATRDHVNPRSLGYTLKNNTVVCCESCNLLKGDRTLVQFRVFLKNKIHGLKTRSAPTAQDSAAIDRFQTILNTVQTALETKQYHANSKIRHNSATI